MSMNTLVCFRRKFKSINIMASNYKTLCLGHQQGYWKIDKHVQN